MKAYKPLSPAHLRLVTMLVEADGAFVAGRTLSSAASIPFEMLGGWIEVIRRHRPDLVIEGKRGAGYRIARTVAPSSTATIASIPGGVVPLHRRMAASMAVLDLLPAKAAELVKAVASESGEGVADTLHRLISYGVEVHRDLVNSGENPVGLRPISADATGDDRRFRREQVLH